MLEILGHLLYIIWMHRLTGSLLSLYSIRALFLVLYISFVLVRIASSRHFFWRSKVCVWWRNESLLFTAYKSRCLGQKKLIIRFSGHFWQKQMRQAGIFFFFFFFYSWNRQGNFFFYYTNPLKGLVSWNAFYSNITIKILNFWTPRHS